MVGVIFTALIFLILTPALAVKGYLLEKTVVTESTMMMGGGMKEVKEVKEYVFPEGMVTEEVVVEGMEGMKGSKSTQISIYTKEGMVVYNVNHIKKQYFKIVFPYEALGHLFAAGLPFLFEGLIICEEGKKCRVNKKFYKFTGKKKKVGKWTAREVILSIKSPNQKGKKGSVWIAKDKNLAGATLTMLDSYFKIIKKSPSIKNNPSLMNLYEEAYKILRNFVRKEGAPVITVDEKMGMRIIETVKNARKIDIPESMLRPPKGYKEFKMPQGMPMMPMMPPPGGTR